MKMVSIIVPIYNAKPYLEKCLNSILQQSYEKFELILVDDGSSDESGMLCDNYSKIYNKVRVIHQNNSGVSSARNNGIRNSNGDYITFIDADDWIEKDYIERMVTHMTPGGFVACQLVHNDEPAVQSDKFERHTVTETQVSVFSARGIRGYACGRLFDNQIIKQNYMEYSRDIGLCEDELFSLMYLSKAYGELIILEYAGYHYTTNSTGATLGRYGHNPPRMKDFTEITALESAEQYIVKDNIAKHAWKQRRDKAAVATLRTMVSCGYKNSAERERLQKMIRKGCLRYLFGNIGCLSGKISILLSAISPELEWLVYRKLHAEENSDGI